MTAETIAKALGGRKAGGGWMARCPAHDDREPSLSIRDADDGKVLVRCHAGCDQERVIAALRSRGLWTENGSAPVHRAPRRVPHATRRAGSRRRQAQRGRARHLAGCKPAERNAGRDLSRLARPASSAAADAPLPCRAEASFRRHLAGDGRAGDARRPTTRRSRSTAPSSPATAAAKRRSIRRR